MRYYIYERSKFMQGTLLGTLFYGFRGGHVDFLAVLTQIIASLVIILLIMPFHEWAHAFVAYHLGDRDVKKRGRLSLNPLSHVDPIGALLIIFIGFGWAKPVPINDRNFKNPKVGMGISALAGPVANLLAAFVGCVVFFSIAKFAPEFYFKSLYGFNTFGKYLLQFLVYYVMVNVALAVFNLLPIPPLDGSKILFMFLPDKIVYTIYKYEQYFFLIIIMLVWFDLLPIGQISSAVCNGLFDFTGMLFGVK